jgi:hypothetical protein
MGKHTSGPCKKDGVGRSRGNADLSFKATDFREDWKIAKAGSTPAAPSYTAAPWIIYDQRNKNRGGIYIHGNDIYKSKICTIHPIDCGNNPLADARLIAAAPELLEALKSVADYLKTRADAEYSPNSSAPTGNDEMRLLVEIEQAIAKAESK